MKAFTVGQEVIAVGTHGYYLTPGKLYTVLEYCPECSFDGNPFVWPAYVRVCDDKGKFAECHANRFREVQQ